MSQQGLDSLFKPTSIAVVGASHHENSAGKKIMKNLLAGDFAGPIMPVNRKYKAIAGVMAYPKVSHLPHVPDLAILCTPAEKNVSLIKQLAEQGCKAVIIIASGTTPEQLQHIDQAARRYKIRVLGPNSMGMILPHVGLNISFSPFSAKAGRIAFVSQSAAACSTILDWARHNEVGFSHFISLGDASDINFASILDYLARDRHTSAILLYMDRVHEARAFMSAARAASRNKVVLVVKTGKSQMGAQLNRLYANEPLGIDAAYDAAIRRAGMLRVHDTHDLFAAVETLNHAPTLHGERLAILTNGMSPAIMAVDALIARGGKLTHLSEATTTALSAVLPHAWSNANPINIIGDASIKRYLDSLKILIESNEFDAVLIMHAPSAIVSSLELAQQLTQFIKEHSAARHISFLTNWLGETSTFKARRWLTNAQLPTYRTPESAAKAFMHLVEYKRNQKQLMETPASISDLPSDQVTAAKMIDRALKQSLNHLDTHQVSELMAAYGIHILPTWIAADSVEAAHIAEQVGYPVVLKLRSPDIKHKSEVSGVAFNLRSATEVAHAGEAMLDRVQQDYPNARIDGLLVQPMARRAGSQELHIAVRSDAIFGPIILLGDGGIDWQGEEAAAVSLLPLNMNLARYLIVQALKSGKIKATRSQHLLDIEALSQVLTKLSHLIINHPQIAQLDIHPLLVTGKELIVIDMSVKLIPFEGDGQARLAIRPYPVEWEEHTQLTNGQAVLLRAVLPEDEPAHQAFLLRVSDQDRYNRFFSDVVINHKKLAHMMQIDYDREMAFIAVADNKEILAVVRAILDPDTNIAEFAILVRSDLKGLGLGRLLMEKIIHYAHIKNIKELNGITMPTNRGMITLARKLGFSVNIQLEDGIAELKLILPQQESAKH